MRRITKLILGLAVVVVLVTVGLLITEMTLRKVVPESFKEQAQEFLSLSPDHPVEVELQPWLTAQYLSGSFKNVQVTVPEAPLSDGMRATLFASAASVPTNPQKGEFVDAHVGATFTTEELSEVTRVLSKGVGQEVELDGEQLKIANTINFLGQKITIKIGFTPEAKDGQIHITPVGVEAAGLLNITVDQLPEFEPLQKFAEGFDICVADKIPKGMIIEEIRLSTANKLTVFVSVDPQIVINESLQELGNC